MLSATKVKTLVDDRQSILHTPSNCTEDLFRPIPTRPSHTEASRGDLDWSYTSRCIKRWSSNAVLTHLYSHLFSVPSRNSSSAFVTIHLLSQDGDDPETVSLPVGYRLPLLMVAKYLWDTVLSALSTGQAEWNVQSTNIFHISRLCENLFASARVKTLNVGMQRGWRCLVFDRFLARLYKHWIPNDPASNEIFWKEHGAREYARDVLRHDWKRWCLRGVNGVRLTEDEITLGLRADEFRKTLILNQTSQTWTLDGIALSFISSDEGSAWSSVSELTDIDLEEEVDEVKPSLRVIDKANDTLPASAPPKQTAQSLGTGSAQRLKFCRRDLNSPRRKSARIASTLASPIMRPDPSSAIHLTTAIMGTKPFPSPQTAQTSVQSSSGNKRPSSSGLVVLLKRRPQTDSLAQRSDWSRRADESTVLPCTTDSTTPASSSSKTIPRPSSKKRETENDGGGIAKRRKIDGSDLGNVQLSERKDVGTQSETRMRVEVSVQTTHPVVGIDKGMQTDDVYTGRKVICDALGTPAATTANSTSDMAVQSEVVVPVRTNPSANTMDDRTAEMQENLSRVVDNLVSSRLLSLTRALKQSSEPEATLGNVSTPTLRGNACDPKETTSATGGHHTALFDELRLLREEAHAREQRTKEEMRALRHLHNAEVDSLRRRLAYLESQTDADTRRASGGCSYGAGRTHHPNNDTRSSDKHHHLRNDDILTSFERPLPGPASGDGFSGWNPSRTRSGNDMEDDSPLPSKAQRKSHIIAFSRPSFGG